MFAEAAGGLISGGAGTAMLLGIPADVGKIQQQAASVLLKFGAGVTGGQFVANWMAVLEDRFSSLRDTAKAVLVMYGVNQGPQVGGSVIGGLGYVFPESEPAPLPPPWEGIDTRRGYDDGSVYGTSDALGDIMAGNVSGGFCSPAGIRALEMLMRMTANPKKLLARLEARRPDDKPVQMFYRSLDRQTINRLLSTLRTRAQRLGR
jgi:hypothetical protein